MPRLFVFSSRASVFFLRIFCLTISSPKIFFRSISAPTICVRPRTSSPMICVEPSRLSRVPRKARLQLPAFGSWLSCRSCPTSEFLSFFGALRIQRVCSLPFRTFFRRMIFAQPWYEDSW